MLMQRPGGVGRRFYSAFYQWTLLVSSVPDSHAACRQAYHTTKLYQQKEPAPRLVWSRRPPPIRKHPALRTEGNPDAQQAARKAAARELQNRDTATGYTIRRIVRDVSSPGDDTVRHFREGPVHSSAERPFALMKAWAIEIRYRSDSSIMLELCIPEDRVQEIQMKHGTRLEKLGEISAARLEMGGVVIRDGAPKAVRSLLISGTFKEAAYAYQLLLSFKKGRLHRLPVESLKGRPTASIKPWDFVMREQTPDGGTLETVIPEDVWQLFNQHTGVQTLEERTGVKIEVGSVFDLKPVSPNATPQPSLRSVLLSGKHVSLVHARSWLHDRNKWLPAAAGARETIRIPIPVTLRDHILGDGEQNLLNIKRASECRRIHVDRTDTDWFLKVTGTRKSLDAVEAMVRETVESAKSTVKNGKWRPELPVLHAPVASPHIREMQSGVEQMRMPTKEVPEENDEHLSSEDEPATHDMDRKVSGETSEDVRLIMRTLSHPVVLVTSREPSINGLEGCRGVTVSSFGTVTLMPKQIITFNLKLPSRTWDAVRASGRLCVHVLSASPGGAAIAHEFTQPHENPAQAFRKLWRLGARLQFSQTNRSTPPRLTCGTEVLARLHAVLLGHDCLEIGDHVIVVAQVSKVAIESGTKKDETIENDKTRLEEAAGLAYANREYRGIGEEIQRSELLPADTTAAHNDIEAVSLESDENEPILAKAADADNADDADDTVRSEDAERKQSNEVLASEDLTSDYFRHLQEEVDDEEMQQPGNVAKRTAAAEEEDDYDLGFVPVVDAKEQPPRTQTSHPVLSNPKPPAFMPYNSAVRSTAKHASKDAWGVPSFSREYRVLGRPATRAYTTATASRDGAADERYVSDTDSLANKVTDPSLLKSTIGDFLGLPDERVTLPRMQNMINARKESERASKELQRAMAAGTLTEEQSLHLERVITVNERKIAKKLALRSAIDLRRMLDKGKVDERRAQWLETSIEKGQVAIVEEARQVRRLFDRGTIDERQFATIKQRLQSEHVVLDTEAMRLRQMYDEDADFGVVAAPEPPNEEGQKDGQRFDGFKGNV